jgi:hypothetical protein
MTMKQKAAKTESRGIVRVFSLRFRRRRDVYQNGVDPA